MNQMDKVFIEYAKLHVQLQMANEALFRVSQEKTALEEKLKQYEHAKKSLQVVPMVPDVAPTAAGE